MDSIRVDGCQEGGDFPGIFPRARVDLRARNPMPRCSNKAGMDSDIACSKAQYNPARMALGKVAYSAKAAARF